MVLEPDAQVVAILRRQTEIRFVDCVIFSTRSSPVKQNTQGAQSLLIALHLEFMLKQEHVISKIRNSNKPDMQESS